MDMATTIVVAQAAASAINLVCLMSNLPELRVGRMARSGETAAHEHSDGALYIYANRIGTLWVMPSYPRIRGPNESIQHTGKNRRRRNTPGRTGAHRTCQSRMSLSAGNCQGGIVGQLKRE